MTHCYRMLPYLLGVAALAVVLTALGVPLGGLLSFLVVLACPLAMLFMMRGMAGATERTTADTAASTIHRARDPAPELTVVTVGIGTVRTHVEGSGCGATPGDR